MTDEDRRRTVRESLHDIRDDLYDELAEGAPADEVVVEGCRRLEDNPNFNAGTGSVLQSDGAIRMSASLMDGGDEAFSAIINASRLEHPIDLAAHLQDSKDRVLADEGVDELMRELDVPVYDPTVRKRFEEWLNQRREGFDADAAEVVGGGFEDGHGTIGVVAFDRQGDISAGTSTGGRGFEHIGRVSDSAMPAGNYACEAAGISCTGIGEDIVDECLAARIAVRVTDGAPIQEAFEMSFDEAEDRDRSFGAIGIDTEGRIAWGKTTDILLAAWHAGDDAGDTIEMSMDPTVDGPEL
jgi:L-asparaginase